MTALHVIGLPHTQASKEHTLCAYTMKHYNFCEMMLSEYDVYSYHGEHPDMNATEHITIYSDENQHKWFGNHDYKNKFYNITWNPNDEHWVTGNSIAIEEIKKRYQPNDIICLIAGHCQKQIADAFPDAIVVEYGIGYTGVFANFKVFESYSHMHWVYGNMGNDNGGFYDCVIPNYFNKNDFELRTDKEDYYLFIGRLIQRKGAEIAVEVTRRLGKKLIMAGQGVVEKGRGYVIAEDGMRYEGDHIEHIGSVGPLERSKLMGGAIATFVPTTYIEPFGGVSVESMFCGTPVVASDFGAFCVPVSAQILTKGGWKYYNEIVVDEDETLGYNFETQSLEWTIINNVNFFEDQNTKTYRNRNWTIRCTDNHRWVTFSGSSEDRSDFRLDSFLNSRLSTDRILLAAPFIDDGTLDITPREAELIGWIWGDGGMEGPYLNDGTGKFKYRSAFEWENDAPNLLSKARVYQAKPDTLDELLVLLENFKPYHTSNRGKEKSHHYDRMVFRLDLNIIRNILHRSRIHEIGLQNFILNLSHEARSALMHGFRLAEGHLASSTPQITQNAGSILDAIELCGYLLGIRVTRQKPSEYRGNLNYTLSLANPVIAPARINVEEGKTEDVWCPTTNLGSWTMKYDNHIVLTGNSETILPDVSGFRFRTIGEATKAAEYASYLNPIDIRRYAVNNFSTEVVKWKYDNYFQQLLDLYNGGGFYSDWSGNLSVRYGIRTNY